MNEEKNFIPEFVKAIQQAGRPPLYDERLTIRSIHLRQDQVDWLLAQPGGMNAAIRDLVDQAMSV